MAFKIGQKIGSYIIDDYKENEYLNAHCEFCNKVHSFQNLSDSKLLKIFWTISCKINEDDKEIDINEGQVIGTCQITKIELVNEENQKYNITAKCLICNETYTFSNCSKDKFLIGELLSLSCEQEDSAVLEKGKVSFIKRPRHNMKHYIYKDNMIKEAKNNMLLKEIQELMDKIKEDTPLNPENPENPENPSNVFNISYANTKNGRVHTIADFGSFHRLEYAKSGDLIPIYVISDKGYILKSLSVENEDGDEIKITTIIKGERYSFTMPSSNIEIYARFIAEKDNEDDE